jgi:hypothetical protein
MYDKYDKWYSRGPLKQRLRPQSSEATTCIPSRGASQSLEQIWSAKSWWWRIPGSSPKLILKASYYITGRQVDVASFLGEDEAERGCHRVSIPCGVGETTRQWSSVSSIACACPDMALLMARARNAYGVLRKVQVQINSGGRAERTPPHFLQKRLPTIQALQKRLAFALSSTFEVPIVTFNIMFPSLPTVPPRPLVARWHQLTCYVGHECHHKGRAFGQRQAIDQMLINWTDIDCHTHMTVQEADASSQVKTSHQMPFWKSSGLIKNLTWLWGHPTLQCPENASAQILARTAEATRQVAGISEVSP